MVLEWKEAAHQLRSPQYPKGHKTPMNHFKKFYSKFSAVVPGLTGGIPQYPSIEVLDAFVGYLALQDTIGGSSVLSYVTKLPRALAIYHHQDVTAPLLVIPRAVMQAARNASRRIPQVNLLERDAISLKELCAVVMDGDADKLVAAAIVIQFSLGLRGINVYTTGKSREVSQDQVRPLQWKDLRFLPAANGEPDTWMVKVRQEKTATRHTGSFAAQPLTASPEPTVLPCPLQALEVARTYRCSPTPEALLFPGVMDTDVNRLLKKHAAPGRKLTTHSLRKGLVTALKEADMSPSEMRMAGHWRSDTMVDSYSAVGGSHSLNVQRALVQHALSTATPIAPQAPQPAAVVGRREDDSNTSTEAENGAGQAAAGQIQPASSLAVGRQRRSCTQHCTDELVGQVRSLNEQPDRAILLTRYNKKYYRAYYYCSVTHGRRTCEGVSNKGQQPYEPFTLEQMEYLLARTKVVDHLVEDSELAADRRSVLDEKGRRLYQNLSGRPRLRYPKVAKSCKDSDGEV